MALSGKVAIITGGARGTGFACVERFLAEGAEVVLADVDEDAAEAALREVREAGRNALFVECDVGDRLDVQNLVRATVEAYGAVDILVNNAEVTSAVDDFLQLKEDEFERVLRTNLKGAFLVNQVVAREMIAQVEAGRAPGSIINMSAAEIMSSLSQHLAYSVSKAGLTQLTETTALALAPHGIRVNAIGSGSFSAGPLRAGVKGRSAYERLLARVPLARLGEPHEIAAIAAFLASDDASCITGQTICADGASIALQAALEATSLGPGQ
ncbi:SDR family NAD(P)-dependent oxidoreductase [Rhodoligotrophos defluvii]|uniref:SDR family NAD(P)-dependent oxidoreductase n=1 Tax=Rhodoligotrophos defluvii TaxID=2561934 RepID=UPI0010C94CBA|nr:SDR family NAD(P)-dependent oxidoreductase [Rhodoligotrophos defluvii]